MNNRTLKPIAMVFGAILVALALAVSANASSLRKGSTSGTAVTGGLPGQVLWGYYATVDEDGGNGDNIIRLVNPTVRQTHCWLATTNKTYAR
jgi:hypothetical protein